MKIRLHSLAIVMLLSMSFAIAQGSKHAIHFDGDDNYIQLANPLSIGNSSHTFELWVRIPEVGTENLTSSERVGAILGAYNSSPHFNYEISSNGAPRIYWNGGEVNSTAPSSADIRDGKWHHLAYVRDTANNQFLVYIDGTVVHTISSTGTDITMTATHRIGGDNRSADGGYNFHGDMDEIRIWDHVRSQAEIRQSMCMKVDTASTGLLHYYEMASGSGTSVADRGGSRNTGTLTNFALGTGWVASGAAIGDTSVYMYPASSVSSSLSLQSAFSGSLVIDSIQNSAQGIHIYSINGVPSPISGIKDLGSNDTYFGVYIAGDTSLEYNARFQYAGFPLALTNEDSLILFNRAGADSTQWDNIMATRYKANDELKISSVSGYRQEFILGNFVGYVCAAPSAPTSSSVSYNSANLNWITGGAVLWDIVYDTTGFDPLNGHFIGAISSNPYKLTGLKPLTSYEYYVRDNCGTQGNSVWVGPHNFTTIAAPACPDPSELSVSDVTYASAEVSFNSISGNSNIEYGPVGFTPGSGTFIDSVSGSSYTLSDLAPSTTYEVYIKDSCNLVNASNWIGPVRFTTAMAVNPNTPVSMEFDGIDDYIQLTSPLNIGHAAHTFELWVKIPMVGTHNLDVGERVGIILGSFNVSQNFNYEIYSNGAPRIWWNEGAINSTASGDYDLRDNKWHHLTFVRDTASEEFKVYIDSELIHTLNGMGDSVTVDVPHRIGGDNRDANGGPSFHGQMDEIRIWDFAKTTAQIREDMCRKIDTAEAGLLYYYDLDSLSFKDKTGSGNDGALVNFDFPGWTNSGAPIGDTSVYLHTSSFADTNISLTSTNRGTVNLDSISGGLHGLHLYKVDQLPNSVQGINDLGDQDVYFGVFVAESFVNSKANSFDLSYDYDNYLNAVSNEAGLNLYTRNSGAAAAWTRSGASADLANNNIYLTNLSAGKQYLLADFIPSPCPGSNSLGIQNLKMDSVQLTWSASGTSAQEIEYGPVGFVPGTGSGTLVSNAASPQWITDLSGFTSYEFYVKDTCVSTGSISWVGPYTFTTPDPCPAPDFNLSSVTDSSAVFDVQSNGRGTDWVFVWGPVGFNVAFGIETKASGDPVTLHGLQPFTSYDVYIKADCDSLNSTWVGPISLTTDSTGSGVGLQHNIISKNIRLYPNPARDVFTIDIGMEEVANYTIYNLSGKLMMNGEFTGSAKVEINTSFTPGIYLVKINSDTVSVIRKLIIRQ